MTGLVAKSSTEIAAPAESIWKALTDPAAIERYYFGTDLTTSWKVGEPITFKGEWQGRAYEDRGVIRTFDPMRTLAYSHFSPLSGKPDTPENHHNIVIRLAPSGKNTRVTLEQDNNANEDERAHSQRNWDMMLAALKTFVEG